MTINYREFSATFPSLREESFTKRDITSPYTLRRFGLDLNKEGTSAEAKLYRVDASLGSAVLTDLAGVGVPLVDAFTVLTGPARAASIGSDVVVNCSASHGVGISIEESASASSWPAQGNSYNSDFDIQGGQSAAFRFTPTLGYYRLKVITDSLLAVSSIWAQSQVRPTGI